MRFALVGLCIVALAWPAAALASEQHPTLSELEGEVMCPVCHTTLDQSNSPVATRIKQFIRARIRAGDTRSEIKAALVRSFGPAILAEPPKRGFGLLAWLLPIGGILVGAGALAALAWRWARRQEPAAPAVAGASGLSPDLERRLDDELARYDA